MDALISCIIGLTITLVVCAGGFWLLSDMIDYFQAIHIDNDVEVMSHYFSALDDNSGITATETAAIGQASWTPGGTITCVTATCTDNNTNQVFYIMPSVYSSLVFYVPDQVTCTKLFASHAQTWTADSYAHMSSGVVYSNLCTDVNVQYTWIAIPLTKYIN